MSRHQYSNHMSTQQVILIRVANIDAFKLRFRTKLHRLVVIFYYKELVSSSDKKAAPKRPWDLG